MAMQESKMNGEGNIKRKNRNGIGEGGGSRRTVLRSGGDGENTVEKTDYFSFFDSLKQCFVDIFYKSSMFCCCNKCTEG